MLKNFRVFFSKRRKSQNAENDQDKTVLCDNLSFSAAEAYKMLRTKVELSLPSKTDRETGKPIAKIIGVTSSIKGEGKSTTSINLAYTLAQTNAKVCILEADMRLPTMVKRLGLNPGAGLSNLLAGRCERDSVLQKYTSPKGVSFYVIHAGDPSPSPAELLGSENMKTILQVLSQSFDYIILDLPPVNIVTDALVVADRVDGLLMVVRANYSDKPSVRYALQQFAFAGVRILGIVTTSGHTSNGGKYGKYGKYQRYGKKNYGEEPSDQ